jgi:hypothetical protein
METKVVFSSKGKHCKHEAYLLVLTHKRWKTVKLVWPQFTVTPNIEQARRDQNWHKTREGFLHGTAAYCAHWLQGQGPHFDTFLTLQ